MHSQLESYRKQFEATSELTPEHQEEKLRQEKQSSIEAQRARKEAFEKVFYPAYEEYLKREGLQDSPIVEHRFKTRFMEEYKKNKEQK